MSEDNIVMIYGLYDPRDDKLRYIGKTNDFERRLWQHINDAKIGQKTHKSGWIRLLLKLGMIPTIKLLGQTTENAWQEDEKAWIAKAKREGVNLTNLTEGGDGLIGYIPSEETRQNLSEYNKSIGRVPPNWKGRTQSPEHIRKRVKARKANNNYGHTEESKGNISKGRKGKALGNTNSLGYRHTEEWKEAARKRSKGKNNSSYGKSPSEETKDKMSQSRQGKAIGNQNAKGHKWTDEQKEALKEARNRTCINCAQKIKRQKRNSPIYVHRSDSQRECKGMSTFAE